MDSLNPYNPFENRMAGSPYTQEQLDYIHQLYYDLNWSICKIAKTFNISSSAIKKRVEQNNWKAKDPRKGCLSNKELKEIKEIVETKKMSKEDICKQYNLSMENLLDRIQNNRWERPKRKNKYTFNENYFDIIDSEHKAYWLGFLMADGYILSKRNRKDKPNESQSFGFSINMKDKELFDYFKQDLNATNPVNVYKSGDSSFKSGQPYGRILLTSQHAVDMLKKHGIVENKTFITQMPNLQEDLIRHFIRGYSDGDGSIIKDKNNCLAWNFCGTKELLTSFQKYFKTNYILSQRFPERNNNNWTLKISGWSNVPRLLEHCYNGATIYLSRKYQKYVEIQGNI